MSESGEKVWAIEARDLTKVYGAVRAIDRVTFRVARGEVVGFLGPNGAGKSTTMRILCGLNAATSGVAHICGIPVASHPQEVKKHIGYMPEHNPLPEDMRVVEYLRFRARLKGVRRVSARVDEVMELCDLHRKARRRVIGTLSKGFRQRVGIADAILSEPEVIVMDEPTIGLDPHQILGIRRLIAGLRGRMTVVISSHILPEIEVCCERVIIINQGRIVASGTSEALRREFLPRSQYRLSVAGADSKLLLVRLQEADAGLRMVSQGEPDGDEFRNYVLETEVGEPIGEKLAALVHSIPGAKLRELSRREPSLEEIFMAATRRGWDEPLARPQEPESGAVGRAEPLPGTEAGGANPPNGEQAPPGGITG